jgi:hypothetical protein
MHRILERAKAAQQAQAAAAQQQQAAAKAAEAAQKKVEQEKVARAQQEREAQAKREADQRAQQVAATRAAEEKAHQEAIRIAAEAAQKKAAILVVAPIDSLTENIAAKQLVLKTTDDTSPSTNELTGEFSVLPSPLDESKFAINVNNAVSLVYYSTALLTNCAKYPKAPCLHPYHTAPICLMYVLNAKLVLSQQTQKEFHTHLTLYLQNQLKDKTIDYFVVTQSFGDDYIKNTNPLQFKPQHWLASNTDTTGKCETFNCNITLLPLNFKEKVPSIRNAERTIQTNGELSFKNTVFTAHDNTCSGNTCSIDFDETKGNTTYKFISVVTTGNRAALTLHTVHIFKTHYDKAPLVYKGQPGLEKLKKLIEQRDKLKAHEIVKEILISSVIR